MRQLAVIHPLDGYGGKRVAVQKLARLPKKAATTVHRMKVSLHGARPPVWRRIEIPSAMRVLVHSDTYDASRWRWVGEPLRS